MLIWHVFFGLLTLASAFGVVFSAKALHSALFLVLTLLLVAVHFALLEAQFLAVLQILIYAGAIMVLVVFVVLLLGADQPAEREGFRVPAYLAAVLSGAFGGLTAFVFREGNLFSAAARPQIARTVRDLGHEVFEHWFYPVQLVGLLLLAAVIAAVMLVHEPRRSLPNGRGLRAVRKAETEGGV